MITISLCMIVKDEEDTLERCLDSVRDVVDEIIIVDTGSTDQTKNLSLKWTSQVYDFVWTQNFSDARNFSFTKATMDYIMWLDADDVLMPENNKKIFQLKQSLSSTVDAVSMGYHCDFDNSGNATVNVRRIRLVKRSRNYQWKGAVHEDLEFNEGKLYDCDIVVTHRKNYGTSDPDRNLRIYESLIAQGKEFTPRDMLHYAMELHQRRIYKTAVEFYLRFMHCKDISTEDCIFVCSKLADCYYHLGDRKKERKYIFKTMEYDTPRPELCCRLGYYFLEKNQFLQASFWYKLACDLPPTTTHWTVQNIPSRTWLPHQQLGLCYYQMGEYRRSYEHNKIALSYLPGDQNIINNLRLLNEVLTDSK